MATLNFVNLEFWKNNIQFLKKGKKKCKVVTAKGAFIVQDYLVIRFQGLDGGYYQFKFYCAADMPADIPVLFSNASTFYMGYEQRKREDIIVDYNTYNDIYSLDPIISNEWDLYNYTNGSDDYFNLFIGKDFSKINYEYINELTADCEDEIKPIIRKVIYQDPLCLATESYNISSIPGLYFEPELIGLEKNTDWSQYWDKPIPLSKAHNEILVRHFEALEKYGIVEEVHSPNVKFIAGTFLVMKHPPPNVDLRTYKHEWRPVNSFLTFNKYTKDITEDTKDLWKPVIEVIRDGKKRLNQIDIRHAYHHILLGPTAKDLLVVWGPNGKRYRYLRMPFGCKQAPSIWNGFVQNTCPTFMKSFFDNLIWSSDNLVEFEKQLLQIARWLYKYNLTIRLDKCDWYKKSIESFGYQLTKNKITPNVKSINNIINLHTPRNKDEVKKLTGVIIWINKFIPKLQEYLKPINKLTQDDSIFNWSEECEINLQIIKNLVQANPFLIPPNPNKPFRITVDGSGTGLGAVLEQQVKIKDIFPNNTFDKSNKVILSSN